jgi:hypothetical protein
MIESNYGTRNENGIGNFELLVAVNGQIQHWRRDNKNLATEPPHKGHKGPWSHLATFGHDVRHVWSLMQGPIYQNLETIVELKDGSMQHWYRDSSGWHFLKTLPT